MTRHLWLVSTCWVASCLCLPGPDDAGVVDSGTDASVDASGDAGVDAGQNPESDAGRPLAGMPCQAGNKPNALCVSGGTFLLPKWSTFRHAPAFGRSDGGVQAEPAVEWALPPFWLDETEVTLEQFKNGGFALPRECGGLQDVDFDDEPPTLVSQVPTPDLPENRSRPVVCVRRVEANAYCASRGGRLPSVIEFLRASRDLIPDQRRFPWGDFGPDPNDTSRGAGWLEYVGIVVGPSGARPRSRPVREAFRGVGPSGHWGLSANAAEFVAECGEDLAGLAPGSQPPFRADCASLVFFGNHWQPATTFGFVGAPPVLVASRSSSNALSIRYAGFHSLAAREFEVGWAGLRPAAGVAADLGQFRSWYTGFRCAYDDR